MRPGDRVRFLRTTGEGIVKKINPDSTVEVEIEDGFIIPALESDLVVVATEETSAFSGPAIPVREELPEGRMSLSADEGLFIAFIPFNDRIASLELVNNSPATVLFSLIEQQSGKTEVISFGVLQPFTKEKCSEKSVPDLNEWPDLILQAIFTGNSEPLLLEKRLRFNPASFFHSKKVVPLANKEGYLFKIQVKKDRQPDPDLIKEVLTERKKETVFKPERPGSEVDLHIQKLTGNPEKLNAGQALQMQLDVFEKALDNAIASGMSEIIFIHGVGNGTLRERIHRKLSGNRDIEFFKDALKEKFGYGATYVKLK